MKLIKLLFAYFMMMLAIFFVGRAVLFFIYFDRFSQSDVNYWLTFLYGLRMDAIIASIALIVPVLILCFSPQRIGRIVNRFLTGYFMVWFLAIVYMENATIPFFAEYDVRPNFFLLNIWFIRRKSPVCCGRPIKWSCL